MKPLRHYLILSAIAATICSNTAQAQCDTVSNLTLTYGKRSIQTNWDAVKDAIGYSVAISTTETVPHVGNLTVDNNFLFNGLKPDQKYCVFVQTKCNDVDNPKSEWIKTCGTMPCTDEQPDITKLEIENEDPGPMDIGCASRGWVRLCAHSIRRRAESRNHDAGYECADRKVKTCH